MAMIDYGSVVKKNGKIIQDKLFMDMNESVGFTIKTIPYRGYNEQIEGNYFSYMGDSEMLVCIYKQQILIISNGDILKYWNLATSDEDWKKYNLSFSLNGVDFKLKRSKYAKTRYKLRFIYKCDTYECLFGLGVDVNKNYWHYESKPEIRYVEKWFKGEN